MVMALERGIALTVFAVGLAVVLLSLVGCGGDGDEPSAGTCDDRNFALPVVGAQMTEDGGAVRFAYAGGEPCSFAVDRHEGRLYVELRTEAEPDRRPPFPSGCAEAELDFRVPADIPVERVYGNARLLDEPAIEALLADDADCTALPEGQAAFVID